MAIPSNDNSLQDLQKFLPLSDQDFRVLLILSDRALHGYGIVKESAAQGDPAGPLELGSLYRIINRLFEDGLIVEEADQGESRRKRRMYRASHLGRQVARAEASRLKHLLESKQAMDLLHG